MTLAIVFILILIYLEGISTFHNNKFKTSKCSRVLELSADADVDPYMEAFLEGKAPLRWRGTKVILKRRGQVPDPRYTARDVVKVILSAMESNDDPQIDHGCCVALEFKSPNGLLSEGGLDPAQYGHFLRTTEYSSLLDFKSVEFIGEPIELTDSLSVKQDVRIVPWGGSTGKGSDVHKTELFSFFLSRVGDVWLLDMILKVE
jgi:hypothetical protein